MTNLLSLYTELKALYPSVSLDRLAMLQSIGTGTLTMSEVANSMKVTTAAATSAVKALEALGLVVRQHDTVDRRRVFVSLSTSGEVLVNSLLAKKIEKALE